MMLGVFGCQTSHKTLQIPHQASKRIENEAMLTDPLIKKDFKILKDIAMNATLIKKNDNYYFSPADTKKLDAQSQKLIQHLISIYHLNYRSNKVHTSIGKLQSDSCYQFYNSYQSDMVGRSCESFTPGFGSCQQCNQYIQTLRARTKRIIHAKWWRNEDVAALVDVFRLKNGVYVYLGLEYAY